MMKVKSKLHPEEDVFVPGFSRHSETNFGSPKGVMCCVRCHLIPCGVPVNTR